MHWYNNEHITEYNNWHSPVQTEYLLYNEGVDVRKDIVRGK